MKRILIFASLAAAFMLTGCNKEEIKTVMSEHTVELMIGDVQTRTITNTSDLTTSFTEGDRLGVFSTGLYQDMTDIEFVVPATSGDALTTTADNFFYAENSNNAVFHAYYPKSDNTAVSGTAVTFTVSNQNGAALFNANDFMTTPNGGIQGTAGTPVTLTFQHQLSLVKVIWSVTGEDVAYVTVNNIAPTATWDYSNGDITSSGSDASIKMWQIEDGGNEFWALIPAQEFSSGKVLFTITTDANVTYQYTPASNITFTSNKTKTFTLAKADSGSTTLVAVSATAGNIGDWDKTDVTDNGGEVERAFNTLISSNDGNFANVTLNSNVESISSITSSGWTPVIASNNGTPRGTVSKNDDGTISITSNDGAWYQVAIVYKTSPNVTSGKYRLKLSLKCNNISVAESDIRVRILQPNVNPGNIVYGDLYPRATDTENFTEITKDFTITNTPTTESNATATPTLENGLLIVFSSKVADNITYSIKDVTIVEVE